MSEELTERQSEILGWIEGYIEDQEYPPTIQEIADAHGISAPKAVQDHLAALARKGRIERVPNIARGIRITDGADEDDAA